MAQQKAEMDQMMRRGGSDPWAVDFNKELAGKDIENPTDTLVDKAKDMGSSLGQKSFSF